MSIQEMIVQRGIKEEVPSNHSFPLSDPQSVLFLEEGSLNLFAIERKNGQPEGLRHFIATFGGPALLFGFSLTTQDPDEIVAVTEKKSRLFHIPLSEIEEEIAQDLSAITPWIQALAGIYSKESCGEKQLYLESSESMQMEESALLTPARAITHEEKNQVHWIQVEEGEGMFLGVPSLIISPGTFPLTYTAWIKARTKTLIKEKGEIKEWKKGLFHFHHIVYAYLQIRKEIDKTEDRELAEKRFQKESEEIHRSLEEMVSVLNPLEPIPLFGSMDPLFMACQIVASRLKIALQKPEGKLGSDHVLELIQAISNASAIRYRQVRLRGEWWKRNCGPLVGFWGPEGKPVALIESKPGRYEMIDPETKTPTRVDKSVAIALKPIAFYLYPTFSDDVNGGKGVMQFYFKHNSKEHTPLLFYSLIAALIALFPPFAAKILFNEVIPSADHSLLTQLAISLTLAAAGSSAFFFFRALSIARIEGRSSHQLQTALWDRLLKLPVNFFRKYASGTLILNVIASERMRALLSGNAARILFSGLFSLFYVIAMAIYAPTVTWIALSLLFGGLSIILPCLAMYAKMQKRSFEQEAKINSFVTQIVSSIGKLRIAGAERNAYSHWAQDFAKYQRAQLQSRHVSNVLLGLNYILPFLMYLIIFGFIIHSNPGYSVGAFLAFNTAFVSFYVAIIDMSVTLLRMIPILSYWERTKVIIQEPLEELSKAKKPGILSGEIHIDEVFFKYETQESPVLSNISLKASPREFIGIVGPSGCGKSTLIRLLLGFEKPLSGAIYYDNKNIDSLSTHDLRRQLGVVLQEEGIIAGTLYDNLTCGAFYSPEQIENALENSGLSEDVAAMPMRLHTYLSTGGRTLSGGQKQRILIARALLPNPKILLLDEATSALDNKNQENVLACIDRLEVTRIVIAHRLSTLRNADRIYAMDKGQFVQVGSYDQLAAEPGLFATMLKRQSL